MDYKKIIGTSSLAEQQRLAGVEVTEARGSVHLMQYPTGAWGLTGFGIPAELAFERKDGKPMTAKDAEIAAKAAVPSMAGYRTRTWKSKAAVLKAAKKLKVKVKE